MSVIDTDKARLLPKGILSAAALLAAPVSIANAAAPAENPRLLIGDITPGENASALVIKVLAFNSGPETVASGLQDRLPVRLMVNDEPRKLLLDCERTSAPEAIEPGHFVSRNCQLRLPEDVISASKAYLSLGGGEAPLQYGFSLPGASTIPKVRQAEAPQQSATPLARSTMPAAKPDNGNAFLGNLSAYAPIYAAYGPGTNSDGKLQISFKYQLFGEAGNVGGGRPLINGLHFAYTQRMFWDLGAESSPFRNIDFMPEIFYLQPAVMVNDQFTVGGQIGFRHESNGRDGTMSRSANTVYIQPVTTMTSGDYRIAVGPRLFFYVGDREDNPDIRRYRGSTGLFAEIGQDQGLRLTTNSRFNFSSGKGAIDAELSYPLDEIVDTDLNLYLFGQGFVGYGENLLDYNRKATRLRLGIAIVR